MLKVIEELKKITKDEIKAKQLLNATLKKETFIEFMNQYFSEEEALNEVDFGSFDLKLSEFEFRKPHYKYHYDKIWEVLENNTFTTLDCKNPVKWLSITYQLVKNENIKPYYLAFYNRGGDKGRSNIKKALLKNNKEDIFDVARAILRRTFGNIQERRGKGVFQDIPFSVVWWQMYFAKSFEKSTGYSYKKVLKFFHSHKDAYNNFIIEGKKLTVIFDDNIRDALFLYFIENDKKVSDFKQVIKTIGIESSWRSLGTLSIEENKKIIESLI